MGPILAKSIMESMTLKHSHIPIRIIRSELVAGDVDSHRHSSLYEVIVPKYNGTCDKYKTV
jgi:hypothetical protein